MRGKQFHFSVKRGTDEKEGSDLELRVTRTNFYPKHISQVSDLDGKNQDDSSRLFARAEPWTYCGLWMEEVKSLYPVLARINA